MYVRITYEKLLNVTKFCAKASQVGDTIEQQSVLLTTDPDGLELESKAVPMWAKAHVPCEVVNQGQVAVIGKRFADVVAALPIELDSIVELADSGSEIEIVANGSSCRRQIPLVALADYSGRPNWVESTGVVSPDICEQIIMANKAAADERKPNLAGVHLHPKGICATDSFKFMTIDVDMDLEPVTIPSSLIDKFPDPNSFGSGDIEMGSTSSLALFRFGARHDLVSQVITAQYPDPSLVKQMIPPSTTPFFMEINLDYLKAAIEGFRPFSGALTPVTLYPDATLTIIGDDGAVASDRLDVIDCELDRPVKFLLHYLSEAKNVMKGEDSCMFLFDPSEPDARPFAIQKDNCTLGMMPMK